MEQSVNKAYRILFDIPKGIRYIILMGGRGAGRSTVASQFALAMLAAAKYFRAAIMRFILGDIRNSIYREITDRAEENGVLEALSINDGTMTIKYGANSINAMGFRKSSGDQKAKMKSLANYNCVIIEEADEIPEEDFMQLDDSLRTLKGDIVVILLLNAPPKSHWIIERWFDLDKSEAKDFYIPKLKKAIKDTIYICTSYLNNSSNLSQQTINIYEGYKETKPAHYWGMIRGYVPEVVRGKIYSGWAEIDEIPHEAKLVRRGLDYGYSNHPSAIVAIYYYNGGYIWDEELYRKGMSNRDLADTLEALPQPQTLIIADSAEPKSNDELKGYGLNIIGAEKGQGSVNHGIQKVQAQRISYTKRSVNLKKEYENYAWAEDKDGNTLNVPKKIYDHGMDAGRYPMETLIHDEDDAAEKAERLMARLRNTRSQA